MPTPSAAFIRPRVTSTTEQNHLQWRFERFARWNGLRDCTHIRDKHANHDAANHEQARKSRCNDDGKRQLAKDLYNRWLIREINDRHTHTLSSGGEGAPSASWCWGRRATRVFWGLSLKAVNSRSTYVGGRFLRSFIPAPDAARSASGLVQAAASDVPHPLDDVVVVVVQLRFEDFQVAHLQAGRRERNLKKKKRRRVCLFFQFSAGSEQCLRGLPGYSISTRCTLQQRKLPPPATKPLWSIKNTRSKGCLRRC